MQARQRARFFELADVFLSSGLVPAYTAAAFAKRFARLALTAPPAGAHLFKAKIILEIQAVLNMTKFLFPGALTVWRECIQGLVCKCPGAERDWLKEEWLTVHAL